MANNCSHGLTQNLLGLPGYGCGAYNLEPGLYGTELNEIDGGVCKLSSLGSFLHPE